MVLLLSNFIHFHVKSSEIIFSSYSWLTPNTHKSSDDARARRKTRMNFPCGNEWQNFFSSHRWASGRYRYNFAFVCKYNEGQQTCKFKSAETSLWRLFLALDLWRAFRFRKVLKSFACFGDFPVKDSKNLFLSTCLTILTLTNRLQISHDCFKLI